MLKILSWNIRQGGGSRIASICNNIIDFGAEIVQLSEYRNNASGAKIRLKLLQAGYRYHMVSPAGKDDNSTAIFSKIPSNYRYYPFSDPVYNHNVISAEYEAFTLFGMYLPHKKKHELFDFLLKEINRAGPSILVGDFNTGINYVDQKGNSFWYTDKLEALAKEGYVDGFREKNGQVKEYSWYSHQGNGYRYDHIYLHRDLLPIANSCYYLHEWRENKLSDHSPIVLELG